MEINTQFPVFKKLNLALKNPGKKIFTEAVKLCQSWGMELARYVAKH